jgi:hypothetical protein
MMGISPEECDFSNVVDASAAAQKAGRMAAAHRLETPAAGDP